VLLPGFKWNPVYYVRSSNINRTFFLSTAEIPEKNKIILPVDSGGIPVTVITYQCMSTCFLSVVITTSEQVVPSAVEQRVIVKFLIKEKVKPIEIVMRLRAEFGDERLSRTQTYDWSQSYKEGRTGVENMRRLCLLQGKLWQAFFGIIIIIIFLQVIGPTACSGSEF
jgi:hypothetical protein